MSEGKVLDEEKVLDVLVNFANALEAASVDLKQRIAELVGVKEAAAKKWSWNPDKVKWVQAEGFRGPYQRYPAKDEKAEATADYQAMLQDLKAHDGKLSRDGFFYWVFKDQATVGRKKTTR